MDKMEKTANMARSLTTRLNNRKKSITEGTAMGRAFTVKKGEKLPYRPEISLPLELLSATNPLAFTAPDLPLINSDSIITPDIKHLTSHSSSASLRSESSAPPLSSATSTVFASGLTTPTDELPEQQMEDLQTRLDEANSPLSPQSQAVSSPQTPSSDAVPSPTTAPAVPKRAPSHTKKSHQALARHRSMSRVRSESTAASAASTPALTNDSASRKSTSSSRHQSAHSAKDGARNSTDMFSARTPGSGPGAVDADHPFSAELAKLTEVAEEFSPTRGRAEQTSRARSRTRSPGSSERSRSRPAVPPTPKTPAPMKAAAAAVAAMRKQKPTIEPTVWDEEQEYLSKHGLRIFSAEDYIAEIGSPYDAAFPGAVY